MCGAVLQVSGRDVQCRHDGALVDLLALVLYLFYLSLVLRLLFVPCAPTFWTYSSCSSASTGAAAPSLSTALFFCLSCRVMPLHPAGTSLLGVIFTNAVWSSQICKFADFCGGLSDERRERGSAKRERGQGETPQRVRCMRTVLARVRCGCIRGRRLSGVRARMRGAGNLRRCTFARSRLSYRVRGGPDVHWCVSCMCLLFDNVHGRRTREQRRCCMLTPAHGGSPHDEERMRGAAVTASRMISIFGTFDDSDATELLRRVACTRANGRQTWSCPS